MLFSVVSVMFKFIISITIVITLYLVYHQMVEETDIVTQNQTTAAAAALNKLTETSNVTITNTTLTTVVEVISFNQIAHCIDCIQCR